MGKLLIVENDLAWIDRLQKLLRTVFEEKTHPTIISLADEFTKYVNNETSFDDIELALVDLELGAGTKDDPGDLLGRDLVLREIRRRASWIPVVLVSQYIRGDLAVLADTTPFDFDAVVTKTFFGDSKTNINKWEELRFRIAIHRVAALTGRSTHEVANALTQPLELDYGQGVAENIQRYGAQEFERLLKLLGLGAPRIVLDEVVFGYSGLSVIKAICQRRSGSTYWLLKFGTSIGKLDRELFAHRQMFENGFTRLMNVPVFWWKPVVWRSLGIIAYQFEQDATTLLSKLTNGAYELKELGPTLQELYRGAHEDVIIPRNQLKRLVKRLTRVKKKKIWGPIVLDILEETKRDELDKPVRVLVGCEHGDLHSRNVLVGSKGPVLIDFAHYIAERDGEKGMPLFDLAKLLVDLTVWRVLDISFNDFVTGHVLNQDLVADILPMFTITRDVQPSGDERNMFRCAATCILAVFSEYEDVPKDVREAICKALATNV